MSITKVQKERVQLLIDDLRSGNSVQGKNALKTFDSELQIDKFCCLGRACELSNLGMWQRNSNLNSLYITEVRASIETDDSILLPVLVQEYYGFPGIFGLRIEEHLTDKLPDCSNSVVISGFDGDYTSLPHLNDRNFTFPMIADIIQYWIDNQEVIDAA